MRAGCRYRLHGPGMSTATASATLGHMPKPAKQGPRLQQGRQTCDKIRDRHAGGARVHRFSNDVGYSPSHRIAVNQPRPIQWVAIKTDLPPSHNPSTLHCYNTTTRIFSRYKSCTNVFTILQRKNRRTSGLLARAKTSALIATYCARLR